MGLTPLSRGWRPTPGPGGAGYAAWCLRRRSLPPPRAERLAGGEECRWSWLGLRGRRGAGSGPGGCCGRDDRGGGELAGQGAAFGALGVQGGLSALGAGDGGGGELAGGFGLGLAGGLDGGELAGGLLAGGGEGVLAGLAGLAERGGGAFGVVAGSADRRGAGAGG